MNEILKVFLSMAVLHLAYRYSASGAPLWNGNKPDGENVSGYG